MFLIKTCIFITCFTRSIADNPLDFLSKFHQSDYKMKFERLDAVSYDTSIVKNLQIITYKYNRTQALFNITFEFKIDLGSNLDLEIQWYKFLSNEYRHFPMQYRINYCEAYNRDVMGLNTSVTCGKFSACDVVKDHQYKICNFIPDESKFPPLVPSGSFMAEIYFMANKYSKKSLMLWRGYCIIYRPMNY